ncbi:MAG: TraR/DksA C4-type zinc finger protein [Patescibacteria group bacterium]
MKKKVKVESKIPTFPMSLLIPIGSFLSGQLKKLEGNKKKITEEDPFANEARTGDNAAPDTEAEEQFGHARTLAIKEQLDRKIVQTRKALTRIKIGKYGICENCGKMIDTDRLVIFPEATLCVSCEKKKEK